MNNEQKLREALQRYGKHEHNCASNNYRFKCACDCGLEEALALPITPSQPVTVTLTDDQADAVSMALRRAWQLGQTYWQQADSDYISQHKKSEETQRKFEKLCDDTIAALREKQGSA